MKSSKIIFFRLFLPFFLASLIFLSSQTFAQDDQNAENRDILDYSDTELVEQSQSQAQEGEKEPRRKEKNRFFNNPPEVKFTGDFSMDLLVDNFIFGGLSYMIGADIDRFATVGVRLGFPVLGGLDIGKLFNDIIGIVGGSVQVEASFSLINFFFPSFTAVDLEFFLRGGAIMGTTLWMTLKSPYNVENAYEKLGLKVHPTHPAFSFYYKPTFTLGLNLLLFEKVYFYIGADVGSLFGSRVHPPLGVTPVGGLAFKLYGD